MQQRLWINWRSLARSTRGAEIAETAMILPLLFMMIMAIFWLFLYVFVNLTSILYLGALAINGLVGGESLHVVMIGLAIFAMIITLGGMKVIGFTDVIQVGVLIIGGLATTYLALTIVGDKFGFGPDAIAGFKVLLRDSPDHFKMILSKPAADAPQQYIDKYLVLPGIAMYFAGQWIVNLNYWGCNQYIIQRALAAKSVREAQKGIVLAAFLKLLMPVIIVLPGIAAVALAPNLARPDEAYPHLMAMLPTGILGLVFAALIAAIVASMGSKINSIATIFTMDVYRPLRPQASQQHLVWVGRTAAAAALLIAIVMAKPLLGSFDQAFQYIQEFTGFFTPGICVIFLLGMFWERCTAAGALVAAIGSFVLSCLLWRFWPTLPFMDRVGVVFLACLALAAVISLAQPRRESALRVELKQIDYSTSTGFNGRHDGGTLISSGMVPDCSVTTASPASYSPSNSASSCRCSSSRRSGASVATISPCISPSNSASSRASS